MKKTELNGHEWLQKEHKEFVEKKDNGVYDLMCGCKILVQDQTVFTLRVCLMHSNEKNNRTFMNMARTKTGKGTNLK